jgi:GNAT superfamily N-acetyltransferase
VAVRIVDLSPDDLRTRMGDALGIYVAAMGYPPGTAAHRAPMWAEHMLRAGWQAAAAVGDDPSGAAVGDARSGAAVGDDPSGTGPACAPLLGIAYGYRGARRQWWCEEVRSGLLASARSATAADALLDGYFELTELHVLPTAQGLGLGEQLLRRLLAERSERSVLLSTPEVPQERNRAWQLYRRLGFTDVLRHFRFAGDGRPFAVLGRDLPL